MYGSITPSYGLPGATESAIRAASGTVTAPLEQQDGGLRRQQRVLFDGRDVAAGAHRIQVGQHDGKRFVGTLLAPAQLRDGRLVRGVDHQLKSADALEGQDLAGPHGLRRVGQRRSDPRDRLATPRSTCSKRNCGPHAGQAIGCA